MLNLIPMPHLISIHKASEPDAWGIAVATPTKTDVRCKITYNSRRETITVSSGEDIVYTADILLEGVPDLDYEDFVTWHDDRGREYQKQPIEISYKHDFSGNPIAIKVYV